MSEPLALFSAEEITGPLLTVEAARARFPFKSGFDADPVAWHSQPVCACGCYIAAHHDEPPNVCMFSHPTSPNCRCDGYRYSAEKTEANREAVARCAPPAGAGEAL